MRQEGLCAANTSVCFVGLMPFLAGFDYSGEVLWPNKQSHRELTLIISDTALGLKQGGNRTREKVIAKGFNQLPVTSLACSGE